MKNGENLNLKPYRDFFAVNLCIDIEHFMNMNDEWEISFCGLNCAVCDIYIASHGNSELQNEIVAWFQKKDPNITCIRCEKCRGEPRKCWSEDCVLRECAMQRGYSYCFECEDFVCEKLEKFGKEAPHHTRTIENMKKMKKMGLKKWIHAQQDVKFCP